MDNIIDKDLYKKAKKKADEEAAAQAKFDNDQKYIEGLASGKQGAGGYDTSSPHYHENYKSYFNNYDPASRGGAAFGNEDYDYLRSQGYTESSINSYLSELDTTQVSNKYKTRGGHTPNASINSGRGSSEGLYQDKYNVGKSGEDDKGDTYLSQGSLGSINSYFNISGNTQEDVVNSWNANDFEKSYADWKHTGNSEVGEGHGGYAGDVLKMIDQNNFKVTDEQYNRLIEDTKNHNWNSQMSSDGTGSGRSHADFDPNGMYDARIGGTMESQGNMNDVTAKKYADWTNPEYYSGASVDARNARKQQTNTAAENVGLNAPFEMEAYKPEGYKYDPWGTSKDDDSSDTDKSVKPEDVKPITTVQDPASIGGSVNDTSNFFKGYKAPSYNQGYQGIDINDLQASYAKMGFNFDPNRFNLQGQ